MSWVACEISLQETKKILYPKNMQIAFGAKKIFISCMALLLAACAPTQIVQPRISNETPTTAAPANTAPTVSANKTPDSADSLVAATNKIKLDVLNRCKDSMRVFIDGKDFGVVSAGQKTSLSLQAGNYVLYARSSKLEARNRVALSHDVTWTLCSK